MGFTLERARPLLVALVAAVAAAILLGGVAAPPAEAANACKRHGDRQPQNLNKKQARNAVICLVNRKRDRRGKSDLGRDSRLVEAAQRHSYRMAKKSCFSHQCPGESSLLERLKKVGYIVSGLSRWAYGENIALGTGSSGTPRKIVNAWMHSSGHKANILSGTFREIGVGFRADGSKGFYTTDFGLRIK